MKRKDRPTTNKRPTTNQTIVGDVQSRLKMASGLGLQYGGKRDVYESLGYPKNVELTFDDYWKRYDRQDIAKAIIDKPVKKTWSGQINLSIPDLDTNEDSDLRKMFKDWQRKLKLKTKLSQLDKLTRIGEYGVMLLGFSDVMSNEDFAKPVQKRGDLKLLYIKPFDSYTAQIYRYSNDPNDPRYGKPVLYHITLEHPGTSTTNTMLVHHSRVIHVVEDSISSDVIGTPILKSVYNRLMDIEKLVGGDAEMFWRGARPGYAANVNDNYTMDNDTLDDVKGQIEEFNHDLRRILTLKGIDMQALAQQIADPANHLDVQITLISAVTEIPKRMLMGSEKGELSSSQDQNQWLSLITSRRQEHSEPNIVRPFVDRMIDFGIVEADKDEYVVEWEDLFAPSTEQKAKVGSTRAEALKKYASEGLAQSIIPPRAFFKVMLGLDDDQIEMIEQYMEDEIRVEDNDMEGTEQNTEGED